MKLLTKFLIGTLVISSLGVGAYAMMVNQPTTEKTISEKKAEGIALGVLKGGIVTNSHLETNNDFGKYEVIIKKPDGRFEVDVDALTGKVLEIDERTVQLNHDQNKFQNISPKIPLKDARKIALDQVRGTITEADLDIFNNRLVYDIEIGTVYRREAEVIVDATNGKVLKVNKKD
jgi:uncharacterized membrane protein YkoI